MGDILNAEKAFPLGLVDHVLVPPEYGNLERMASFIDHRPM